MTPSDLGLAAQANGDGALVGEFRIGGDSVDLKLIEKSAVDRGVLVGLEDTPVATPTGHVVPMRSVAEFRHVTSPPQINHAERQRSVTLLFTAPQGMALEQAVVKIGQTLEKHRGLGSIPPDVGTSFSGSAPENGSTRATIAARIFSGSFGQAWQMLLSSSWLDAASVTTCRLVPPELPELPNVSLEGVDRQKRRESFAAALKRLHEPFQVKAHLKHLAEAQRKLIRDEILRTKLARQVAAVGIDELRHQVVAKYPGASTYTEQSIRHLAFELRYQDALQQAQPGQGSTATGPRERLHEAQDRSRDTASPRGFRQAGLQ